MTEQQQLQTGIAALEAQRGVLGDDVLEAALAPMRTKLTALQSDQQLKQVTVLFADIVGSTTLSQHLDPEDIHAIMDGALQQFTARVQAHGGRVLQYAGDSLLAVFGADEAREDDAECAVLAGLAVLEEGRAQGEQVRLRHGHEGFNVRVGIHTGAVLLGGGVDAEGSIRGMTVNIAARMEQSAPVGALRVSQATWRQVAGAFEGEAQPRLEVKGSDEPLLTWIVRRARPLAERERARGVEGLRTPLVGRDVELAEIERLLGGAAPERGLQAVTLIADAGLGKTRMLAECRARLLARAPGTPWLMGRAHPQNRLQPYGLLRDLLARWLHIADDDSAQDARRRLVEGLAPRLREDAEGQAQIVGQLIGLDFGDSPHLRGVDARQMRDRAFRTLTFAFGRLQGEDGSLPCLLLEDLHWADDASLDFVRHLLVHAAAQPLRLLMTARPGLLELRPAWGEGVPAHRLVHLGPLAAEHSFALAHELLSRVDHPQPALRELLVTRAEGNPFYMEELVKMLLDQGAIVVEGEIWCVHTERLAQLQVPGTLVGVLQARLDALPAADRRSLQQASIVGPVFWDDALAALDERALQSLPALRHKALVQPRGTSAFEGTREQMFHHHLLHQVTYDTVLKAARREGHAKAALWLADRVGDRTSEYLAVTAEHYDRAGDKAQAIDYFERAIREAARRDAHTVVLAHVERVLAMPEMTDARRRYQLLQSLTSSADLLGRRDLQAASLHERERLAEALGDDGLRASTLSSHALLLDRQGDDNAAYAMAQRALALAEPVGEARAAALSCCEMAWVHYTRGELDVARSHVNKGLDWARQIPESTERGYTGQIYEIQSLTVAADIERSAHDYTAAAAAAEQALALARSAGERRPQNPLLNLLGQLALELGDWPEALRLFESARALSHEMGQVTGEAAALQNLAAASFAAEQVQAALAQVDRAIEVHQRGGQRRTLAQGHLLRARVLSALGDDAAHQAFATALLMFDQMHAEPDVCTVQAFLAEHHRQRGELGAARRLVADVLMRLERGVSLAGTEQGDLARLCCQRVLAADGDERAGPLMAALQCELQGALARFADPATRERFLDAAPWRREIMGAQG